jgi:hypothetical protein
MENMISFRYYHINLTNYLIYAIAKTIQKILIHSVIEREKSYRLGGSYEISGNRII